MPREELKAIEAAYPIHVEECCNQMLKRWLEMDINATWKKLTTVINAPAASSHQGVLKGNYAVLHVTVIASYNIIMYTEQVDSSLFKNQALISYTYCNYHINTRYGYSERPMQLIYCKFIVCILSIT